MDEAEGVVSEIRDQTRARCVEAFAQEFGRQPSVVAWAPGRVNLIGEHIDYSGGHVLPMTISRVCVAAASMSADPERSRIFAADLGERVEVDFRRPVRAVRGPGPMVRGGAVEMGSWASYVIGSVAELAARLPSGMRGGVNVDLAVSSSVPLGSGLSSSASLEVAVVKAVEELRGVRFEPVVRAAIGRAAEHNFAGVPCGVMDQMISAMGEDAHALLIDTRDQSTEQVPLPDASEAVVVVMNTNVHHALASGEYGKRRAACESAARKLGVEWLCDASIGSVRNSDLLNGEERACAEHAVLENGRTLDGARALRAADLTAFGALMGESHRSLRNLYKVSCLELDTLVDAAEAVEGVFGARMTGGGFGGCAIAMARPECVEQLREVVGRTYRGVIGRDCEFFLA